MKVIKFIVLVVITAIVSRFFELSFVKEAHFDLITVNSVLIGFLFTSLSILLGFLNETIVKFFEEAGALKDVYKSIEKGIEYSLFSIIMSFVNLMIVEKYIQLNIILKYFYGLEINFIIVALYFLFKTLYYVKIIVNSINVSKKKESDEEKANKKLKDTIEKYSSNKW